MSAPRAAAAAGGGLPSTIVSLTFDDGTSDQYWALGQLQQYGMAGTFYVNSAKVGTSSSNLTWSQLHDLYAAGNEIGGHTSNHVNLPQTDPAEAQRQICNDRVNLINQGFSPTDFAYPYGAYNATVQQMVKQCGYNSARGTNSVPAESLPPADPYGIRVAPGVPNLSAMENAVTSAEQSGGGWLPFVFHEICSGCASGSITQSDFTAFLQWLQGQEASGAVSVQRVADVIGGSLAPGVMGPAPPAAPNGWNVLRNASLEYNSSGGSSGMAPDCFQFDGYGSNNATWSWTNDAHSGSWAERVDVTNYQDGDAKLVIARDQGRCTPTVTPGHQYVVSEWYKSSAPVSFSLFTRDSLGASYYWMNSPTFPASSSWVQAVWTTPAVPAGVTGLTYGLSITSNGFVTVDDFGLQDANPTGGADKSPPSVSLVTPAAGTTVGGTVAITAQASDNVAVDHLDFLIDGKLAGSTTDGLNTYNWYSPNVADGAHTLAVRAVDPSGNATTTSAISVNVLNARPNLLQNASLETGSGTTPSCWQSAGYGTNSSAFTWTTDAHTGSRAENLNMTAWSSGDRKLLSGMDTGACAPAGTVGHSYTVKAWYKTPVGSTAAPYLFAFYRNSAGSWVSWGQSPTPGLAVSSSWTQASWQTPVLPAGATNISVGMGLQAVGSVTMDDLSLTDNSPPPDTTPPTSTINCNGVTDGGGCASGWYGGDVQVALSGSDTFGGSGLASIRYTTDGSDPSLTNGMTYAGPFTVTATATVKYRAYDNAGNAEAVHSQLIQVDRVPPTSTVSCNGQACGSGWYNAPVSVGLAAGDTVDGVAFIRYTTDGSDPTTTNGHDYLGPFSVANTSTVKFRAYDDAGNAEAVNSQLVQIDTTAPAASLSCNGTPCSSSYYGSSVNVSLSAVDDSGGSGVAAIYYTTDGSVPTATPADLYSSPVTVAATSTITYFAVDVAGNAEPINTATVAVDTVAPSTNMTCNGGACANGWYNQAVSVGLSASDNPGGSGVASIIYTTDGSDPTLSNGVTYTGAFSLAASAIVKYRAYDNAGNGGAVQSQGVQIDSTLPTSSITCNGAGCSAGAYTDSVNVALLGSDNGGGAGIAAIYYTTDGSTPTASLQDLYGGPFSLSTTTLVRYFAVDNAGNMEGVNSQTITMSGPGVTVTSPTGGASVNGTVPFAASVTGSTVDHVEFRVDGAAVGSATAAPYGLSWDSTTVPDGQHTVVAVAYDAFGGETDSAPVSITVSNATADTTPPVSGIACNAANCTGWYTGSVSVALSASDGPAGSGVASIRYTTDGSDPTASNGNVYNGSFSLFTTTTVKYRAYDNAGNAEPVNTQLVQIDTVAPASSIGCNGGGCSGGFYSAPVSVSLAAADSTGGSGVAAIMYTTDGSDPSPTNGTSYVAPFSVNATTTVKYRAYDIAGNAEPVNATLVQIDTTPPTSTMSCNGGACAGWANSPVSVALAASDNAGGSGLAAIRYTTDGSDPSPSNGTPYSGAFSVSKTTTVKYRAYDNAGNAEAVHTQLVQIDTVAPSSSIACNGAGCASSFYKSAVSLSLAASDNAGGSGVTAVRYTTDGTTPSSSNGQTYTAPFSVSTTTTVKYRAFDQAGNPEPVNTALIQVDTTPPSSTISCNGGSCAGWAKPGVSVALAAADNAGGSGVASIRYTTDGTVPTATNGSTYATPLKVNATTTISYRAYDAVGNAEAVNTQTVQIDGTAPTVSLSSPSAGLVAGNVTLSATATDNVAIDHVDLLVDGAVVGTVKAAPYTLAWNSATVPDGSHTIAARAVDLAGNTTTTSPLTVTTTNNNLLQNPSLETASGSTPTCWLLGGYGTNTYTWTRTSDAHTGAFAENLNMTSWTSGDRKLIVAEDNGACAPAVTPGHTYTVTVWYKLPAGATTKPYIFAYTRTAGTWNYWTQSQAIPLSSTWAQATWTTPAIPAGTTNLSIGMGVQAAGAVTIDDLALYATG